MEEKTIKERAIEKYCTHCGARTEYNCSANEFPCPNIKNYIKIATEQFAIDKEKADVACGNSYRNGYYDAKEKACNIFCHQCCPHKTDNFDCLDDWCIERKAFTKALEE